MKAKFTQYICAALAAAMLTPLSSAYAKEWVHVSSWAYNDVSNFTNEELLPESFDSISDYREPITVEQFCELLYNVSIKSGMLEQCEYKHFIDSDSAAINTILRYTNIVTEKVMLDTLDFPENAGETMTYEERCKLEDARQEKKDYYRSLYPSASIYHDENGDFFSKANPSNILSREGAADILASFNSMGLFVYGNQDFSDNAEIPEGISYPDASPEAYRGIYLAKLRGFMDASADPKANMTIEQAITAVYRLWKAIPTIPREDGNGIITDTETLIQTYANGVEEYQVPMYFILKKDGVILKRFESDIYKNIYCADTVDGRRIAAAQTYNKDTELYNLADGSLIAKLNYLTDGMDSEYIITKSSDTGPMYFGLCAYDGSTVLEPRYSMEEIEILRNNGFKGLEMPYRKPDGWIYYSDRNDNGKMYRIDSNGENKQLLCGEDCYNTKYIDGYLYYWVHGENEYKLFCMKADGTEKEQISNSYAYIYTKDDFSRKTFGAVDGWLYYIENDETTPNLDEYSDGYLWRLKHTSEGTVKEQISDFKVRPISRSEDCMYFIRYDSTHCESYMLTKDGFQKLDFDNKLLVNVVLFYDTAILSFHDIKTKIDTTVCAPIGSTSFIECTHEHKNPYHFAENGIDYYPRSEQSDSRYQVGDTPLSGRNWIKDLTSGVITYIDIPGYIFDRKDNILYLNANNDMKLYSYDIETAQTSVLAENVIGADKIAGNYIACLNTDKNYMRVNIQDGKAIETYPNTGALRYGEFDSLRLGRERHLLKLDKDGRYVDLTGSPAEYYGYVAY